MTETLSRARRMRRAIEPLIYARRALTMAVLLALTLLLGWQAAQLKPDTGFEESLPLDHPMMRVYEQYRSDFGGANTVFVALIQKDGDLYNKDFLARLKQMTDAVSALPGIDPAQVHSLFTPDMRFIEVVEGGFFGADVIPAEFSLVNPSVEMLAKVRANVGKANVIGRYVSNDQRGAMIQAGLLEIDPVTGRKLDYTALSKQLEDRIRARLSSEQAYDYKTRNDLGVYKAGDVVYRGYSDPGSHLESLKIRADKNREDGSSLLIAGSELDVISIPNPDYAPNLEVHIVGFAKRVGDVMDQTRQVAGFFAIMLAVMVGLLALHLGSFKLALLPLLCSIAAVVWTFGLLKLMGFGLDPFAMPVPLLILAISISHGVHSVQAWTEETASRARSSFDASLMTWRRQGLRGTMALVVHAVGCGAIGLIPIESIREMAFGASLGMFAIIVTNHIMLPIALTWVRLGNARAFATRQHRRDAMFDRLWHQIAKMTDFKPAVTALVVCSALLGASLWESKALQIGDNGDGAAELRPDSRYNLDSRTIADSFALGTDVLKIIAETDADSCTQSQVMEQIDTLAWQLQNMDNVRSTVSLPQLSKVVYTAFSEGSPKFKVLPRNRDAMIQAIAPITPLSGMLNANCSAMPIWVYTANHSAATIKQITARVQAYNLENAEDFFDTHKDVDAAYCETKTKALRNLGIATGDLRRRREGLRTRELGDAQIATRADMVSLALKVEEAKTKSIEITKICPVNFALAAGAVGVKAATNAVVEQFAESVLLSVYIAIAIGLYLVFFEWASLLSILLPLALVSCMAYAVMALLGIGLQVTTLPIIALGIGIGVDYGVQVYATLANAVAGGFSLREAYFRTLRTAGKAVILTGLMLAVAVATWMFSGLQFQRDLGKLLIFIFAANLGAVILILPAVARFLLKERKPKTSEVPKQVFRT